MLAGAALSSLAREDSIALVADPTHTVQRRLAHQVLASLRWLNQNIRTKGFRTYHIRGHGRINQWHQNSHRGYHFDLSLHCLQILGSFGRESRAFLAACMLTGDADLFGTESCLTSVTLTVNPHADLLFNALGIATSRRSPFAWLQGQAVLGEQCTSPFFLKGIAFGSSSGNLPSRCLDRFAANSGQWSSTRRWNGRWRRE